MKRALLPGKAVVFFQHFERHSGHPAHRTGPHHGHPTHHHGIFGALARPALHDEPLRAARGGGLQTHRHPPAPTRWQGLGRTRTRPDDGGVVRGVGVGDPDLCRPAPGVVQQEDPVTIDLDVEYDIALTFDENDDLVVGNTTLPDSQSAVIFVNAPAGPIHPTVSVETGTIDCSHGLPSLPVEANTLHLSTYLCEVSP